MNTPNNFAQVASHLEGTLLAGLRRAGNGDAEQAIATAQAERGGALVAEMFAAKIDPMGNAWAPQKYDYGNALMERSGDLAASGSCVVGAVSTTGHEIVFRVEDFKTAFHQRGTRNRDGSLRMVARPVMFEGDDSRWRLSLDVAGQAALDRFISGMEF